MTIFQEGGSASWLGGLAEGLIRAELRDAPGAHDTAVSWLLTGLVIAALATGAMVLFKKFRKDRALLKDKPWSLAEVFGYLAVGLFPIFAVLLAVYYLSLDFTNILGVQGLFKGVACAWLLYVVLMVGNDLIWPWSRTDYRLR